MVLKQIEIEEDLMKYVNNSRIVPLGVSFALSLTGIILQQPDTSFTGAIIYNNYINNSNPNALFARS